MITSELFLGFESEQSAPSGIRRYTVQLRQALTQTQPTDWSLSTISIPAVQRALVAQAWSRGWKVPGIPKDPQTHFSRHATSLFAPITTDRKTVVTIHDMVPFTHPETLTPHGARWHQAMIHRAVEFAGSIVVPTHAIGEALKQQFPHVESRQRIIVAGGASSLPKPDSSSPELIPPGKYVVFVGTIEPRKQIGALIEAVARLTGVTLVVVGNPGWGKINLENLVAASNLSGECFRYYRNASDQEVSNLLVGADALVLPSEAEGFGLPVVEAMSLGTPVIISEDPALMEVAGGAGVVAPGGNSRNAFEDNLAQAIEYTIANKSIFHQRGINRSAEFSWTDTANKIWDLRGR